MNKSLTLDLASARVLITGAAGMLGSEVSKLFSNAQLLLTDFTSDLASNKNIEILDITDAQKVAKLIEAFQPDFVINCAAYTNVDLAEKEIEKCFAINSFGPQNIANALKNANSKLVHISTDYVFGANKIEISRPYLETDSAAPCGVYGMSKYVGDQFVSLINPQNSLILRTSWLHGRNGKSFVDKIIEAAKVKSEIKVVNDQVGSPTWAPWLAGVIVQLCQMDKSGIYNVSSKGNISWYDFAKEIVSQAGLNCKVLPQSSLELSRPAPRPHYSVLDISKLEQAIGNVVDWKYGIEEHLKNNV